MGAVIKNLCCIGFEVLACQMRRPGDVELDQHRLTGAPKMLTEFPTCRA